MQGRLRLTLALALCNKAEYETPCFALAWVCQKLPSKKMFALPSFRGEIIFQSSQYIDGAKQYSRTPNSSTVVTVTTAVWPMPTTTGTTTVTTASWRVLWEYQKDNPVMRGCLSDSVSIPPTSCLSLRPVVPMWHTLLRSEILFRTLDG